MSTSATKNPSRKNLFKVNLLLLTAVIALAVTPLLMLHDAEFSGSDDKAEKVITEMNSDYKPWFHPLWEPPSSEIESLLFALQAALGAGFIGYYMGFVRGKRKAESNRDDISR
ncbi:Cobalt transport protein cbiN [Desulfotomaculum nigrificans CO-1-SRB]|uniref:Cobalt transport protein CbiN n=1 Tax=Desulfotomaculum nigrificans (strain DSM 14880 / VKM B-2319 / CO-1-SRB) TaxID=868595 RepID=F6B6G0_DESCC|nr:energy-coupling factor ABC transporter substrate-binding protein [Desulfotomaculum nigrificans]AEF93231.1 Cobalt transport protein cbiN [Desulfotomaculum nigrificans CO-1-SRB]